MASKGMTMNAVIKLTATQFNAGIKQVQRSLNSLKSTFLQVAGALGAGLGLSTIINQIKNTATQLSIAKATLENVAENGTKYGENVANGVKDLSKASKEYADNMAFLKRISNEYGQDLLGLSQAFAKFRAAAGYAGVSLTEIKRIFEALTKAAGAYHLTAEQTANAMLAVEQMFSKGKVTSEELRRQLGNALPGAFGLMAKAAGMTTGEFEKAMKAGQILAADVLPKFADELNKVTQGANFDSLQSSLNRFSNAWTQFTEKTHFEDFFQKIVDSSANAIRTIGDNFKDFAKIAKSIFLGIAGGMAFSNLEKKGAAAVKNIGKEYAILERKNIQLTNQVGKLSKAYTEAGNIAASMPSARIDVEGLTAAEAKAAGLNQGLINIIANNEKMGKVVSQYSLKAADAEKVYANRLNETNALIKRNEASMQKLQRTTKLAGTAMGRAFIGLRTVGVAAFRAIGVALSSIGIGLLITALSTAISYLKDVIMFSRNLKKETEEIEKSVKDVGGDVYRQIAEAKVLADRVNDISSAEEKRQKALDKLNEKLGLSGKTALTFKSTAEEINSAIEKWSDNIIKAAKRMGLLNKVGELTARNVEIQDEIDRRETDLKEGKHKLNPGWARGKIERLTEELKRNEALIQKFTNEAEKITAEIGVEDSDVITGGGGGGLSEELKKFQKVFDDYSEKQKELSNQYKNKAISKKEYEEESGKLAEKTWKEIAAFDNLEDKLKTLGTKYDGLFDSINRGSALYTENIKREEQIKKEKKAIKELQEQYDKVEKKYNELVSDEPNGPKQRDTFFDYKKTDSDIYGEQADNAEDYAESLENLRDKLLDLREDAAGAWATDMEDYLDMIIEKLGKATDEAKNLREQANFAELAEDIKKMKKELEGATFKGIKEFSEGFHSLAESVKNAGKAFAVLTDTEDEWKNDDEVHKKFEAMMQILDEITQMYNSVTSVIKMFTETEEKRANLEKALAEEEKIRLGEKIATKEVEKSIEEESGLVTAAAEAMKQGAIQQTSQAEAQSVGQTLAAEGAKQASITTTTGIEAGSAVVGAMDSVASIPYVGPILAAAAAATITALIMTALSKFATGGIVGGNSYSGDNNIVRANSGEMILNKSQQGHLWNMITGKEGMSAGRVEFVLRGDRLLGAINNYQSKRRG